MISLRASSAAALLVAMLFAPGRAAGTAIDVACRPGAKPPAIAKPVLDAIFSSSRDTYRPFLFDRSFRHTQRDHVEAAKDHRIARPEDVAPHRPAIILYRGERTANFHHMVPRSFGVLGPSLNSERLFRYYFGVIPESYAPARVTLGALTYLPVSARLRRDPDVLRSISDDHPAVRGLQLAVDSNPTCRVATFSRAGHPERIVVLVDVDGALPTASSELRQCTYRAQALLLGFDELDFARLAALGRSPDADGGLPRAMHPAVFNASGLRFSKARSYGEVCTELVRVSKLSAAERARERIAATKNAGEPR